MEEKMVFKPRPSIGWFSLSVLALFLLAAGFSALSGDSTTFLFGIVSVILGLYFILLAIWWPTMRYEVDQDTLTLLYGKVINYSIPVDSIRSMKRVNLGLSLWASTRMPGVALFTVRYSDVGQVRMCSTSALNGILLIETENGLYGITPEEEEEFVATIQARMRR